MVKTIWAVACLASVLGVCLAVFSGCGMTKTRIQEKDRMDVGEGPRQILAQLMALQKEPAGQRIQGPPPFVASDTTTGGTVFDPSVNPSGDLTTSRTAGVMPDAPPDITPMGSPPVVASGEPPVPASSSSPPVPPLASSQPMSRTTVPTTGPSSNPPAQNIASGRTQALPATASPSAPPAVSDSPPRREIPRTVVPQETVSSLLRGNQASAVHPANQGSSVRAPVRTDNVVAEDYTGGPKYRIGPEDILHVSVWGNTDLTLDVIVRPDGKISLPLIQDVTAEGLTTSELAEVIHQKLLVYIKDPAVSVMVKEINATKFYVLGYVNRPGIFALRGDISVLQALSMAGGLTPFASPRKIRLLRNIKGVQKIQVINYYALIDSGEGNYLLKAGDTIVVP